MLPALPLLIAAVTTNVILFIILLLYVWKLRIKEKTLEKKEGKVDTQYHQVVNDALTKERKIIDDATHAADQIITGAQYVSHASKETVDKALQEIVADIRKESVITAKDFTNSYHTSLKDITIQSLKDFQNITKEIEEDLQKQIKEFHSTILPHLEKELEEYKQARLKETEEMITHVIQKASQEILNKAIPLADHQNLVIESLEKAKKEGVFS